MNFKYVSIGLTATLFSDAVNAALTVKTQENVLVQATNEGVPIFALYELTNRIFENRGPKGIPYSIYKSLVYNQAPCG